MKRWSSFQFAAMVKDVLCLLWLCTLSHGRIVNIAILSDVNINTTEIETALRLYSTVNVVLLNITRHHLLYEATLVGNSGVYDRFLLPETICNSLTMILHHGFLTQRVTCFRLHDEASEHVLYFPVLQFSESIQRLMQRLNWSSVLILTDESEASRMLCMQLSTSELSCSTVVINSSSISDDIFEMLQRALSNIHPYHILLMANIEDVIRVLWEADSFDVRNHRRSDMRSSSEWLVVVEEGSLELFHTDVWVDNIAVLVYPAVTINTLVQENGATWLRGNIFTLMYRKTGRELEHVGRFDHYGHIEVKSEIFPNIKYGFNGRLFVVGTMRWLPYIFIRNASGIVNIEGICIDVIKELANIMNFTYQLILPPDLEWGVVNTDGKWTGLVGQMQRNEIDMIVAALGLSHERLSVVDFSYPFGFDHGVGIYKLTDNNKERWLTLIRPFVWPVHLTMTLAFVVCAMSLYALRWWHGEAVDISDTWLVVFGMFIRHSIQVRVGSISSSCLVCFLGLFGTIVAAVYCGNMIAFFTISKQSLPFTTLPEVTRQTTYKWGTLGGSLWVTSFQLSRDQDHQRFWNGITNFNQSDPDVLHTSEIVQKAKVKGGNYVFVVESDILKTWKHEDCSLRLLSDSLFPILYAIGLPRHSPFTKTVSKWIILFHERGLLDVWRKKWMPEEDKCVAQKSVKGTSVTLLDLQSAFYALGTGVAAAMIAVVLECTWRRRSQKELHISQTDHMSD